MALAKILARTLITGSGGRGDIFLDSMTKGTETSAQNLPRFAWADAAKGFVILIVVLAHAVQYLESAGYNTGVLRYIITIFQPIGMPMFFMISGMFTGRHMDGSFREFWKHRLRPLVWILLIWVPIDWTLNALFPTPDAPSHGRYLWQIPLGYLLPTSYIWFIWSLAAYSLVAHLLGRRHPWPWLILSFVLCLAMLGLTQWHYEKYGLHILATKFSYHLAMTFFFFFYAGYIFRDRILGIARGPALPILLCSLGSYVVLAHLAQPLTGVAVRAVSSMVIICLGVFSAIHFGRVIASWRPSLRLFSQLGGLSLPIYLLHLLIVLPIAYYLRITKLPQLLPYGAPLALGVATLAVLMAILITLLARRFGLTFLFAPPARLDKSRGAFA
jgi:uncharacterized membrane protein YcfT